ncbi:MAG: amidohydrolase [Bacilli bacterium]|nr:amidohydrolase [Bacilli bacterium]
MKILLKNAKILTLKNKNIIDGEILVDGNKIAQIARKINMKADRVVNCEGNLLMPGFKNAHAHSAMTFLRGYAENLQLYDWLNKCVFPSETRFIKNDIYHLSKLAYLEYLSSGITACFDMYYFVDEIKRACEDIGMRSVILLDPRKSNFDELISNFKSFNKKNSIVSACLGFHAHYTTTKANLKKLSKISHQFKAPIYTHCSETSYEVLKRQKLSYLTPVAYLDSLGLFDYGGGIFHGVYLTKEDVKILKKHHISVCTCPASNLKLASGIAPVKHLFDAGINVAIGTDGPASNNALDMFREAYLTSVLSKIKNNDPVGLQSFDVLKMATVNGAKMMNLKDADVLAKNKLADIIMIDLHQPNMQPLNNIFNDLVYSASKINVKMTMINGKILYYNHKYYLNESVEKIYEKAKKITNRLIAKK